MSDRQTEVRRTPEDVMVKQGAAARNTRLVERQVLRKQPRKARADHAVKGTVMLGKKIPKRKPLTELYVDGNFTEDGEEWKNGRHCDEVYVDPEKTIEVQEERIEKFKREGDRHFTEDGRGADITLGLLLQARAKNVGKQGLRARRCRS